MLHELHLFLITFDVGFKVSFFLGFSSVGNPRYLKGKLPTLQLKNIGNFLQPNLLHINPCHHTLMKNNLQTWTPSNNWNTTLIDQILFQLFSQGIKVSSIICKWKIFFSSPTICIPLRTFWFTMERSYHAKEKWLIETIFPFRGIFTKARLEFTKANSFPGVMFAPGVYFSMANVLPKA